MIRKALMDITASEEDDRLQRKKMREITNSFSRYLKSIEAETAEVSSRSLEDDWMWDNSGALVVPGSSFSSETDLIMALTPQGSGHSGIGRSPAHPDKIFIVLPVLKKAFDASHAGSRLNFPRMVHELTHYLDDKRTSPGYKGGSAKKYDSGDIGGYFNDPLEYNAHYQGPFGA